jgi:hypothetical protein
LENSELDWTQTFLHCGDTEFLRTPIEQQLARLQSNPYWTCKSEEVQGGARLHCTPTERQYAFDSRIVDIVFNHPTVPMDMGAHQFVLTLQNDKTSVKAAVSRIWQQPVQESDEYSLITDDSAMLYVYEGGDTTNVTCTADSTPNKNAKLPVDWQKSDSMPPTSQTFPTDTESSEGVAILRGRDLLTSLSTCRADHWLSLDYTARLQALREAGMQCEDMHTEGIHMARCIIPPDMRTFGGFRVQQFRISDSGDMHESVFDVNIFPPQLAAAMAKETMTELTPFPGSAGMYQNLLDDRYQHIVFASEGGDQSQLVCRMSAQIAFDEDSDPGVEN